MLLALYLCGLLFALRCLLLPAQATVIDEVSSLQVWLTVDSLARVAKDKSSLISRQIEINWLNAPLDPDGRDYIALYLDVEPEDQLTSVPVSIHKPTSASGKFGTNYYLPYIDFYNETTTTATNDAQSSHKKRAHRRHEYNEQEPSISHDYQLEGAPVSAASRYSFGSAASHSNRWHQHNSYGVPGIESRDAGDELPVRMGPRQLGAPDAHQSSGKLLDECLGYCVAYQDGRGQVLARSCLKTQPNWMRESQLGARALPSLMIPGTHNSGTYPKQLDRTVLQMINKYQINQEESVFNQLVYGIRYLDLRVGFSKNKQRPAEELWIYHDIFRTDNSLREIFEQVRKFLELTQDELIVLDFHRFTVGFQNEPMRTQLERHEKVLDLLFATLGDWIVPSYLGLHAPINEYTEKGKRLIVCYAGRTQLLGSQSDQQHYSLILSGPAAAAAAATSASGAKLTQVRDIDAERQDDAILGNSTGAAGSHDARSDVGRPQPEQEEQPSDRRVGTRIYNRLKSLKLISHSFSKRSIPSTDGGAADLSVERPSSTSNVYKNKRHRQQPDRSMKVSMISGTVPLIADSMNSKLSLLFNSVRHIWPNRDTEADLRKFIDESACRRYLGELRSLMAEMTPGVFGAISDQYDGIRRMSHLTNRMVTDQIRSKFLHCLNLVASDYFLGNDLIRLSIYANKARLHHRNGIDLNSLGGQCKSFRRIEHLLDKTRIGTGSGASTSISQPTTEVAHPDKESDLISFFKRIFNL